MSPIPANDDMAAAMDVNTARDLAAAIGARLEADAAAVFGPAVKRLAAETAKACAFPTDQEEA